MYKSSDLQSPNEICHDVLFREGKTRLNEVTYTPRLVAFDLKGSLKSLKQEGTLYETSQDNGEIRWRGDITLHKEEATTSNLLTQLDLGDAADTQKDQTLEDDEKSEEIEDVEKRKKTDQRSESCISKGSFSKDFRNLESRVDVWSDFLRTHYHPRSLQIVSEYGHKDDLRPFDLFTSASEILSRYETVCEWEDRLHHFTEECDYLQGFHVLMDTHNGFGGLGSELLKYVQEEFPRKGILTFGFTPANVDDTTATARASRIINSALVFDKTCEHSSLFVPASLASSIWRALGAPVKMRNVTFNTSSYHTSSILASALDTLSLPYRLETDAMHIQDITHSLNSQGRVVASLSTALPVGLNLDQSLIDYLTNHKEILPWTSLTPNVDQTSKAIVQSVVLRGLTDDRVKSKAAASKLPSHLSQCRTRHEALVSYLHEKCGGNPMAVTCLESAMKTAMPYPNIFDKHVSKMGDFCQHERSDGVNVESVPVMTALQSSSGCQDMVKSLHAAAGKLNLKKHNRYIEQGLEEDEYIEVVNNLETLAGNYNTETNPL